MFHRLESVLVDITHMELWNDRDTQVVFSLETISTVASLTPWIRQAPLARAMSGLCGLPGEATLRAVTRSCYPKQDMIPTSLSTPANQQDWRDEAPQKGMVRDENRSREGESRNEDSLQKLSQYRGPSAAVWVDDLAMSN